MVIASLTGVCYHLGAACSLVALYARKGQAVDKELGSVAKPRRRPPPAPAKPLTEIELRALLLGREVGDVDLEFLRSALVIGLVTETGIRASELANLQSDDIDIAQRTVSVRNSGFSPLIKESRLIPISDHLATSVQAYHELVCEPSFAAIPGRFGKKVTPNVLHRIVAQAQLSAGLTASACGYVTEHPDAPAYGYRDLRATAFHTWVQCGFTSEPISELAGWRPDLRDRPIGASWNSLPEFMAHRFREHLRHRYDRNAT